MTDKEMKDKANELKKFFSGNKGKKIVDKEKK